MKIVGRLAPSPTGALHLGNARTFLLAWLSARQQAGRLILRIEDIDSPRVKPWAISATIEDLKWLGLDWDIGPEQGSEGSIPTNVDSGVAFIQRQRLDRYHEVLQELIEARAVYPCICSRSDVASAASAPHQEPDALEGPVYPGTCRNRHLDVAQLERYAWRFRVPDRTLVWHDELHGTMSANPAKRLGDFVVAKGDGSPAYQLAVVVDDHDMQVNEVIRGDDLIYSTFRQRSIQDHFGWQTPRYFHVPLVVGPDGKRLAKRHGDTRIRSLREAGLSPRAVVGYLAKSAGIISQPLPVCPQDLIGQLDWAKLTQGPTVFSLESGLPELKKLSDTSRD